MADVSLDPVTMTKVGREAGEIAKVIEREARALANTNFDLRGSSWDGEMMTAAMNHQDGMQQRALAMVAVLTGHGENTERGSTMFQGQEEQSAMAVRNLPGTVGGAINGPTTV